MIFHATRLAEMFVFLFLGGPHNEVLLLKSSRGEKNSRHGRTLVSQHVGLLVNASPGLAEAPFTRPINLRIRYWGRVAGNSVLDPKSRHSRNKKPKWPNTRRYSTTSVYSLTSLHHDISTLTGEEIVIFTFADTPRYREAKIK